MNKFGVLRQKVLDKLTELYLNENKNELIQLVKEIKKDKKFSELHLFYENIEQKTINDKNLAELFVEEVTKLIKGNNKLKFDIIENHVSGVESISLNECHEYLDTLMEEQTLLNIERIVVAKKKLVDYLLKEKVVNESIDDETPKIDNTNLLNVVLVNDFNSKFSDSMNEDEKKIFKEIISMSVEELNESTDNLRSEINTKIDTLLSESTEDDVKEKLNSVLSEINILETNRFNYYRLMTLKDGLI